MKRVFALMFFFVFVLAACGEDDRDIDDVVDEGVLITFDTQGGGAINSRRVDQTSTSINLPTPVREGYDFIGWYLDEDFVESFDLETVLALEEVTLYAMWEAIDIDMITVTFETFEGSSIADQEIVVGTIPENPGDPVLDNALFTGWYLDSDLTENYDFDVPLDVDTTLYASWMLSYEVSFVVEGSVYETYTISEGTSETFPSDPTLTGHTFEGWYFDSDLTDPVGNSYSVHTDLIIYARFELAEYYLQVEMYDAGVEMVWLNYGDAIELPENPEVDGYSFMGWFTDEAFTQPFEMTSMPAENVYVYARFVEDANVYTVTFIVEGDVYTEKHVVGGEMVSVPEDPVVIGYTFTGWYEAGELFDFLGGLSESLVLVADFTPNNYTIQFYTGEGSNVEPIMGAFNSQIMPPEEPLRDGYTFAGWYEDADFNTPFIFDVMPFEGANLYAKWIQEDTALTLFDIIVTQSEEAAIEEATVIFVEYWDDLETTISVIKDDTAAMYVLGDFGFVVGDVVSFDASLMYEGTVPTVVHIEDLDIIDSDVPIDFSYQTIDLEALREIDPTDPFTIGVFYQVTGLVMIDDFTALFDVANERFYPLINVALTELYDTEFEALDHGYVTFGFMLMLPFEDDDEVLIVYLDSVYPVESVVLDETDKLDIIETLVRDILDVTVIEPGWGLDIPPVEPFFNTGIDFEAIGDNAHLYDKDSDTFEIVYEEKVITFAFTLTLNGQSRLFEIDYTLYPQDMTLFEDLHFEEEAYIHATVVSISEDFVVLADDTGLLGAFNYSGDTLVVGERYVVDVWVMPQGPMVMVEIMRVLSEGEPHDVEPLRVDVDTDHLVYAWGDNSHTGFVSELEGVLIETDAMYPFALYTGETLVYLAVYDVDTYDFYASLVGQVVTLDVAIIGYTQFYDENYIAYMLDQTQYTERDMTNEERFELTQIMLESIEQPFRLNREYTLPLINRMFDVEISYEIDPNDEAAVTISENGMYGLVFEVEAAITLEVTLSYETETFVFNLHLEAEDYQTNSIAYALTVPEGTRLTFELTHTAVTKNYHYVLVDETGIVLLDANTIMEWIQMNTKVIITGELYEYEGVYWIENAVVEEMLDETDENPYDDVTEVDFDILVDEEAPYNGVDYVEVTGYLQATEVSNGQLSLWDEERNAYITLGIDPYMSTYLWQFYNTEVTLRGYFITDDYWGNILAVAERVETEVVATVGEMQFLDEGTRVRADGYAYTYYEGLMYVIDDTGMIPITGMHETFALNRVGMHLVFYANLIDVGGDMMLDVSDLIFLEQTTTTIDGFIPFTLTTTIGDMYSLSDNNQLNKNFSYSIDGTVEFDEGDYYLSTGSDRVMVHDPYEVIDWDESIGEGLTVSVMISYAVNLEGEFIVMILPE